MKTNHTITNELSKLYDKGFEAGKKALLKELADRLNKQPLPIPNSETLNIFYEGYNEAIEEILKIIKDKN